MGYVGVKCKPLPGRGGKFFSVSVSFYRILSRFPPVGAVGGGPAWVSAGPDGFSLGAGFRGRQGRGVIGRRGFNAEGAEFRRGMDSRFRGNDGDGRE